ncbi:16039_t:CDS:2 [Dentiscutata heterogama]|uniref:16039_t:CDS:1 n=1 Tax=Dentiscutata heterogama TaxID=1316150 RepID=A0ACA9LZS1_9GLOM|nr:16039_t:CDS:2 [Dentiscutata heterogama]
MTSSIDVVQYPGNGIHAEEVDVENKSTSSSPLEHPRDKSYASSVSGSVTIVESLPEHRQMIEEEKDKSKRKKSKSRGLRHILKREEKDTVTEKLESKQRSNDEKKSESLARTLSGMFSHKSKSEKEKRKDIVDNKNRIVPRQTNDGSEIKSKNRRSFIFSDNEDEATEHAKRDKRTNINDSPLSDNENGLNKSKNGRKNRISLNIDKLLGLDDDHKHKNFNNNNITDLFLPETNGSPIKTYKGRIDSSGSVGGRDSPVSILKRTLIVPNQTDSQTSHTTTFAPSVPVINDHSQETKIESVESVEQKDEIKVEPVEQKDETNIEQKDGIIVEPSEQKKDEIKNEPGEQKDEQKDEVNIELVVQKKEINIEPIVQNEEFNIEPVEQNEEFKIEPVEQNDEFKDDDLDYPSTPATSVNEDLSVNEQELKLVSQVSSDSLSNEIIREGSYYQVNKAEISNNIKDPIDVEITNEDGLNDSDQGATSITTTTQLNFHEHEHLSSTSPSESSAVSKFLISNINTDSRIQNSLNHDIDHNNNNLEEDDIKREQVYHIENKIIKTPQIVSPIPQIIEKQVNITQENPHIQKLEELQAANESLNNAKIQLESKLQEQSQQIAKLTSLETINESLTNLKNQLESKIQEQSQQIVKLTSLESTNETLINVKDQLESKVQEQSQQIAKLTSLESVMVRQFEVAERMEETMRRLEAKVNYQKEEFDGLLAGRMEDTIRQLEYKLNEQSKEVEGLKSIVGQLCSKNSSTSLDSGRADTLVNTLVVKPLVNTITVSASIATSVLYAVYVRPVVGLVKVVRHGL